MGGYEFSCQNRNVRYFKDMITMFKSIGQLRGKKPQKSPPPRPSIGWIQPCAQKKIHQKNIALMESVFLCQLSNLLLLLLWWWTKGETQKKSSFGFSSLGRQQLSLYLRRDNHLKIGIETDLKTTKSPFNHAEVLLYISNDFPTMLIAKQEDTSKIQSNAVFSRDFFAVVAFLLKGFAWLVMLQKNSASQFYRESNQGMKVPFFWLYSLIQY